MSQIDTIKKHIEYEGKITSWEAIQKYRITRLAVHINQLREQGMDIRSDWKEINGKHFVEYVLETKTERTGQLAFSL
jgi:hypothetical protein